MRLPCFSHSQLRIRSKRTTQQANEQADTHTHTQTQCHAREKFTSGQQPQSHPARQQHEIDDLHYILRLASQPIILPYLWWHDTSWPYTVCHAAYMHRHDPELIRIYGSTCINLHVHKLHSFIHRLNICTCANTNPYEVLACMKPQSGPNPTAVPETGQVAPVPGRKSEWRYDQWPKKLQAAPYRSGVIWWNTLHIAQEPTANVLDLVRPGYVH